MKIRKFQDANLKGKRVLLRVDFNVPVKNGKVGDDTRIVETLPTIKYLLKQKARLIICSHLGRPDGKVVEEMRMKPAAQHMAKLLKKPVKIMKESTGSKVEKAAKDLKPGQILFLENIRFHKGEEENDPKLAKQLANLAEVYVSDSFANAHRNHASMTGIAKHLPSYAGYLTQHEVEMLFFPSGKPGSSSDNYYWWCKNRHENRHHKKLFRKSRKLFNGWRSGQYFFSSRRV